MYSNDSKSHLGSFQSLIRKNRALINRPLTATAFTFNLQLSSHYPSSCLLYYCIAFRMPSSSHPHPTLTQSYSHRATLPNTHPLAAYLLNLMSIKQSNLCVSADVCSSAALLQLAEDVGDSICILKTHADIVDDWSERTVRELKEISRQKGFLLFEDRKFGDIGSTQALQFHGLQP